MHHAWLLITLQIASELRLQPSCPNGCDKELSPVTSLQRAVKQFSFYPLGGRRTHKTQSLLFHFTESVSSLSLILPRVLHKSHNLMETSPYAPRKIAGILHHHSCTSSFFCIRIWRRRKFTFSLIRIKRRQYYQCLRQSYSQYVPDETLLFKCNFPYYDLNLNRSLFTLGILDCTGSARGNCERGS